MGSNAWIVLGVWLLCGWRLCGWLPRCDGLRDNTAARRKVAPKRRVSQPQSAPLVPRRPRIVYAIFAGRRWFMEIHLQYTDQLLRRGYVDEVHVWDFCDRGAPTAYAAANRAYLTAFFNATDRHAGYRYFPPRPQPRPINGSVTAKPYRFAPFYEFYATAAAGAAGDVLVKADDDVVFLDLARFPSFVAMVQGHQRQRPAAVFYFPNILNNDYAYYAAKATPPFAAAWTTYYAADDRGACPVSSWRCNATSPVHRDGLFERGDMAHALHRELLVDVEGFVRRCVYSGRRPRAPRRWSVTARADDATQRLLQLRRRISINFFATTLATAREAFPLFLREHCCDDEAFVGRWPTLQRQRRRDGDGDHVVDTAFAVVHFAFAPQYRSYRSAPPSLRSFIDEYRALATRLCRRSERGPQ
eukprot:gene8515-6144_t